MSQMEAENFKNKSVTGVVITGNYDRSDKLFKVLDEGYRVGMIPSTARQCVKPWKIPGDNFVIPARMNVIIPIVKSLQRL